MSAVIDGVLIEAGERLYWPLRKGKGKPERGSVFEALALLKRPAAVRQRVAAVVNRAPPVMVKITGGGRGSTAIYNHFTYISRHGDLDLENERGETINDKKGLRELIDEWKHSTAEEIPDKSTRREAFNIMFSMPPDRDATIVRAAVRDVAKREFANHPYVFVLHTPESDMKTERPHVHLAVRAEGFDGKRLNPRKADIQRWRNVFAHELQRRGMEANADPKWMRGRFKQFKKAWQLHAEKRGEVIQYPSKPPTEAIIQAQETELKAWKDIYGALSKSDDPVDRQQAVKLQRALNLPINRERDMSPSPPQR